ncbi:hypothetical protein [Cupriavidus sp. DF5525]|nr:hypothetical protein N234_37090 [Ralstonia pickettii DTP0602]
MQDKAGLSVWLQYPQPQKLDVRAPIHLALEELEPVDVTLGLAIAAMAA